AAIQSPLAADADVVVPINIDQRRNPLLEMPLDARFHPGKILDVLGTLQHALFLNEEAYSGLKKQGAAHESPLGNEHRPPTGCRLIDRLLDRLCVQGLSIANSAEISDGNPLLCGLGIDARRHQQSRNDE